MNPLQRLLAVSVLTFAAIATSPAALAQRGPVVDGTMWLNSSPEIRKAFLVGVGNMIMVEEAYAKKKGTAAPVAGGRTLKAVENMTLDEIAARVTRWYEANPAKLSMPVMGVIWVDIVEPRK